MKCVFVSVAIHFSSARRRCSRSRPWRMYFGMLIHISFFPHLTSTSSVNGKGKVAVKNYEEKRREGRQKSHFRQSLHLRMSKIRYNCEFFSLPSLLFDPRVSLLQASLVWAKKLNNRRPQPPDAKCQIWDDFPIAYRNVCWVRVSMLWMNQFCWAQPFWSSHGLLIWLADEEKENWSLNLFYYLV